MYSIRGGFITFLVVLSQHCRAVATPSFLFIDYIRTKQDVGNGSTPWGVRSPAQLNLNQSWAGLRGLNSLQMLSYLLSAYRVTRDNQFLLGFKVRGCSGHVTRYMSCDQVNVMSCGRVIRKFVS